MVRFLAKMIVIMGVLVASPVFAVSPPPEGFGDLAERLMPAVVNIAISQTVATGGGGNPAMREFFEDFFGRPFPGQRPDNAPDSPQRKVASLGSGFVIDADGIIITNNHVVENADEIMVNFANGDKFEAEVLGRDPKTDIAVLKVKTNKKLPFVTFGDNGRARVGDWVIAIGNPFGLGGSLSAGVISAINRDISAGPYDSFIQTDAAINRGNSGGPLFNLKGEVIGVNSAIISPTGGSVGIGFAIPADLAKSVVAQLLEYGETRRGWLGVRIQEVTDELAEGLNIGKARGALIAEITPNSPADKGGLKAGDVIIAFDGKPVPKVRDLPRLVAETEIKKRVRVTAIRKGETRNFRVVVERLDESEAVAEAPRTRRQSASPKGTVVEDMTLSAPTPILRRRFGLSQDMEGVLVVAVAPDSKAYEAGIRAGQLLREIDQTEVATPADVKRVFAQARRAKKKSVLVLRVQEGVLRFTAIPLK